MSVQVLVVLVTAMTMLGDSLAASSASKSGAPTPPLGWTTVWVDDFEGPAGTGVSPENWRYDVGTGYPGGPEAWGTGEKETTTSSIDNVHVDGNGHLLITPIKSDGTWTSGRIETERSDFAAPKGGQLRIAASIQLPNPASGLGYWPAFWMLGSAFRDNYTGWPGVGEIDIMESVNALSQYSGTLHCGEFPAGPCNEPIGLTSGLQACNDCQTVFHTYSVVIDRTNPGNEEIRWYLDDTQYFSVSQSQVGSSTWQNAVDHPFFVILDLAIGGGYPGGACNCVTPTDSTSSGAAMQVAYVAVYEHL